MRVTPFLLVLLAFGYCFPAMGQNRAERKGSWSYGDQGVEFRSGDFELRLQNRGQFRFTFEDLDPGNSKGSYDIARYKIALDASLHDHWTVSLQADLANGSETSKNLLEDALVRYTRNRYAQAQIGQGKVMFGRQELTPSHQLQFVDRSIASERFAHGRDVGAALIGENTSKTYSYAFGLYNGDGINKDEGDNIDYLIAARLVVTPFGEYALEETDIDRPDERRFALGLAVITNTTGTEDIEEERLNRGALEIAYKTGGWTFVAEFFTESENTILGDEGDEQDTDGWYAQGGYLFRNNFEVAARYSEILRDVAERDETELGVAFGYHLRRLVHKVQLDYRRLEFDDTSGVDETTDRDEIRAQLQVVF